MLFYSNNFTFEYNTIKIFIHLFNYLSDIMILLSH